MNCENCRVELEPDSQMQCWGEYMNCGKHDDCSDDHDDDDNGGGGRVKFKPCCGIGYTFA